MVFAQVTGQYSNYWLIVTFIMPVTAVTSKSNASPGKGKLRWTSDMRSALLLLNDELNDLHLTHEELAALFNNIFKRETVRDGVQNGMTYRALARQYNDRDSTVPGARGRWAQALTPARADLARQRRFIQVVRAFVSRHAIDGRLDISELQRSLPITIGSTAAETETAVVTPSSERLKRRTTSARQQYRRQNGTVINASAKQIAKSQLPLMPVPDYVARPPVTLLFRFWDHLSAGVNSNEGFIAGRFVRSEIVPTNPRTEIDHLLSDIEIHINRDSPHHSRGRKIASPFISASNFLAISLRLALKSREDGARQFRVTVRMLQSWQIVYTNIQKVIDAERLDPRQILCG
ncbi:hypothetical protein Tdes44962_MAKER09267 [Teratosphaeria destructans]|uniref:DUF7587 domain-containing protein n=1 Tax=Teratosphaeria destructans TaxID=418781 RepID=A0A9W7W343_9PEZI|nr:hypothetical protein Tdes44962_MAKER09267 [Teratosphaeria destructans]